MTFTRTPVSFAGTSRLLTRAAHQSLTGHHLRVWCVSVDTISVTAMLWCLRHSAPGWLMCEVRRHVWHVKVWLCFGSEHAKCEIVNCN